MVNKQMDELMNLLKQMDSTVKSIKQMTETECNDLGFSIEIAEDLSRFTKEQVEAFTPSVIMNVYNKFKVSSTAGQYPENYDEKVSKIKENILNLYPSLVSYKDLCLQRDDLAKDVQKALEDYSAYLSSDEMKEKEAQQIKDLKDRIESSDDALEKKMLLNRLKILDDSETLNFFFDRIHSYEEKEIKAIEDAFFNKRTANYIMEKYSNKMRQMKYNPSLFQSLLDIEANFLEEEYHPFNNLFLFAFTRYIAYINTSSEKESLFAQTLITKVSKLVYHKLSKEDEDYMLDMIRKFDDLFADRKDYFIENNMTSPLSSYRIEMEKKRREETLENIENWFHDYNINLPSWYTYEQKVEYMKVMQEKVSLKSWLDSYEIEYSDDLSLEDLRAIKDSYNATSKVHNEQNEESDEPEDIKDDEQESEDIKNIESDTEEVEISEEVVSDDSSDEDSN